MFENDSRHWMKEQNYSTKASDIERKQALLYQKSTLPTISAYPCLFHLMLHFLLKGSALT